MQNPKVSILVHDWTTPRTSASTGYTSPPSSGPSALTAFLQNMNSLQLSSISATLNGVVTVMEPTEEAARFFLQRHLALNPVDSKCYVDKPDIAVIKVRISSARIADVEDHVEKWIGEKEETPITSTNGHEESVE